jgi:hypothetical protein
VLDAFVQSDIGEQTWTAHYELDVPIVESQRKWTPLQRNFLMLAADEYAPDPPDKTDINARGNRKFNP